MSRKLVGIINKNREYQEISKNWEKWRDLEALPPVVSKNWEKWEAKWKLTEAGLNEDCQFNFRSGDHLRWLFYDKLQHPVTKTTETGLPVVDVDTVGRFGETGKLLESYLLNQKEMGFIEAYLELTENRPTIHAGFKTPGTLTGRLSGTAPNLQQLPKSRRFLQTLVARPGHVWIDADFTALEPVVCTELTGDPALMAVYGPDAEPGADIYLHTGAGIPALAKRIRAEGYIPGQLTKDIVAHVKKACKQERAICKVVYLSSQYGAGPKKIHETLNMQGVKISEAAVREIHYQYWELYKGIKLWEAQLLDQWRVNNGWVLNGIGRPIGVHPDYKKDIVNRVIQSTGHDILVHYIFILDQLLRKHLGSYTPIVMDFHDQTIIEVAENKKEDALYCFRMAIDELNRRMGGVIPLRIVPQVVTDFAQAKLEE